MEKYTFKLEKVELVLENCEVLVFEGKDVVTFRASGVTEDHIYNRGCLTKSVRCDSFYLEVSGGGVYVFDNGSSLWEDRLRSAPDITSVILHSEGKLAQYRVNWPDDGAYTHPGQGLVKEGGNYIIFCSKEL